MWFTRVASGHLALSAPGATALWSFAVDYGDATYACVSWEQDGNLWIGLVDVLNGLDPTTGQWTIVSSTNITLSSSQSGNISDHWHIYAHGYHVLTYSVDGAALYMIVVSVSGTTFGTATETALVNVSGDKPFLASLPTDAETNDHHCLQADDGTNTLVAIVVGSPSSSTDGIVQQEVYVVNIVSGTLSSQMSFASASEDFRNLSSAAYVSTSHAASATALGLLSTASTAESQVLATGNHDRFTGKNALYLYAASTLNSAAEAPTLLAELPRATTAGDRNLAMGTQVLFTNGWRLVMFRDRDAASATSPTGNDAGNVVLWLLDENLDFAYGYSEEQGFTVEGVNRMNRPHATRMTIGGADYLLVGYDTRVGALLRVYDINYYG